ncbi:hypothetical protein J6P11_05395 [bacterium]|nr:hypothetical protein [bacterium]
MYLSAYCFSSNLLIPYKISLLLYPNAINSSITALNFFSSASGITTLSSSLLKTASISISCSSGSVFELELSSSKYSLLAYFAISSLVHLKILKLVSSIDFLSSREIVGSF